MYRRFVSVFVLMGLASVQAVLAGEWGISGLEIVSRPAPIIDIPRIRAQQAVGCAVTSVRFGDTAFMRGFALPDAWPEPARRLLSGAEMTDNASGAYQRYRAALASAGLSDAQRAAIEGQWLLATLQFGEGTAATQITNAAPATELPPEMRADRLFWNVLMRAKRATADDWSGPLDADLAEAQRLDRSNFAVRAWRVFAWFKGIAAKPSAQFCASAMEDFQRRVLDVSEASPCPLMLGHFDHALSRFIGSAPEQGPDRPDHAWHIFAAALMAEVARNTPRTDALAAALSAQKNPGPCREFLLDSVNRIRRERRQ